jgi:hypothetical protein
MHDLVKTSSTMRVLLVSANRERLPSPVVPLGVLAVAGAIRDAHDASVLDLCFESEPHGALRERIAAFRPDVIGLGLRNLHTNAYDGTSPQLVAEYGALVRTMRDATRAPVVLGGAAFSLRPTTLLAELGGDHGVGEEYHKAPHSQDYFSSHATAASSFAGCASADTVSAPS